MSGDGMVVIAIHCDHCDYWQTLALPADGIGSHGCMQCDGQMAVFIAQGSREAVQWHHSAAGVSVDPKPENEQQQ